MCMTHELSHTVSVHAASVLPHLHEILQLAVLGVQQLLHGNVLHPAPQPLEHFTIRPCMSATRDPVSTSSPGICTPFLKYFSWCVRCVLAGRTRNTVTGDARDLGVDQVRGASNETPQAASASAVHRSRPACAEQPIGAVLALADLDLRMRDGPALQLQVPLNRRHALVACAA